MTGMVVWIGGALLGLAVLAAFVAVVLLRKFKAIVLEFYKRLETIGHEAGAGRHETHAVRHEVSGVLHEVAAVRHEVSAVRHEVAGLRNEVAAARQEAGALRAEMSRLYFTTRIGNVLANENVTAHLDALRVGTQGGPVTISYAFSRAVRLMKPLIVRRGDSKTVICSVALGEAYINKILPALTSQQFYAEAHGMSYAILTEPPAFPDRPPAWMKIPLIMNLFEQGFERVIYIDADALVTNCDFDVESVFGERNPQGSLHLTEDEVAINCGVMFLEDGPVARRLLDLIWLFDADVTQGTWEQYALRSLMDMSATVARHVTIEKDQRRFNSFPVERNLVCRAMEKSIWRPGDFICHFSGIRSPQLETLIQHYATGIASLPYYTHSR